MTRVGIIYEEALATILVTLGPLGSESVALAEANTLVVIPPARAFFPQAAR